MRSPQNYRQNQVFSKKKKREKREREIKVRKSGYSTDIDK